MHHKKIARHGFADTSGKQRLEREALPLFADLIAQAQPGEDAVMQDRASRWAQSQQRTRDARAARWSEARRRLAAMTAKERSILRHAWIARPTLPIRSVFWTFCTVTASGASLWTASPSTWCPAMNMANAWLDLSPRWGAFTMPDFTAFRHPVSGRALPGLRAREPELGAAARAATLQARCILTERPRLTGCSSSNTAGCEHPARRRTLDHRPARARLAPAPARTARAILDRRVAIERSSC